MSFNRQKLHLTTHVTHISILSWAWVPVKRRFSPGSPEFKFFSCIYRPLEAMAQWEIFGPYSSEDLEMLEWNAGNFWSLLFGQRRTAEFSLVFLSVFLGLSRGETKTSKLAKIAFKGHETVRKQHRHNLNGNSRTSITRTRIIRTKFPFPLKKFNWSSNSLLSRTVRATHKTRPPK